MFDEPLTRRSVLRQLARLGAGAVLGNALASCTVTSRGGPPRTSPLPNIIVILVDDLGVGELASEGNPFNETPHLDALAKGGMTFTQAYAAAPVCSPTRAALLTGLNPVRTGVTDFLEVGDARYLEPSYLTLNEALHAAGYVTGMIGKWHLTGDYDKKRGEPSKHGWNEVHLSESRYIGHGDYVAPYDFMPEVDAPKGEYLTDGLHQEARSFIERHQREPFFLYLSHYAVHTLLKGKPEKVEKYRRKPGAKEYNPKLAAMLESIDDGVGQMVQTLEDTGLLDNTLLIFTSDNGGDHTVASPAALRGAKSQLYEGGIRVPFIAHWPARISAATTCAAPIITTDIYPTCTDIAAFSSSLVLDGASLTPLFGGEPLEPRTLHWHYPRSHPHPGGGRSSGALRQGDTKLITFYDTGETELYDLAEDARETRNLASAKPERVQALQEQMSRWQADVGVSRAGELSAKNGHS